ncbi:PilN domain-containing protein [Iningainema tapete]|uniref:PilN domain-containing protein n=1 Tax=Iningainema tapete BLCC-T55 TaxID=2748662 RepID=A0A8J6XKZ2_9CYAN|nr:PilN domain-containing protein [Iningainema tapete]MBD2778820.1 PilN domain-containing protein [Iningainema tapete BLCC-T55]
MYSLDVNFLKDRQVVPKSSEPRVKKAPVPAGSLKPVYVGVVLGLVFPVLAGLGLWLLQGKNAELEQSVAQLEQEKQKLEQQLVSINKIKEETSRIKSETQALVTVFDQIRPWSAILQDLRDRIPRTVQIEKIKQTPPSAAEKGKPIPNPAGGLEISGLARTFKDVNDFMLTLQQSRFLKSTDIKITSAELVDAPLPPSLSRSTIPIKPPQIVKYTIQSSLSDIPASSFMRELEQKGTVGLVTRIRSLQQTGVIPK